MNILEHIKELCEDRGWTIYKLADEAGVTQSTLTNMFYRKTLPTIGTLMSICNAFDISLAQFFDETSSPHVISAEEETVLKQYRKLSKKDKKLVETILTELTK